MSSRIKKEKLRPKETVFAFLPKGGKVENGILIQWSSSGPEHPSRRGPLDYRYSNVQFGAPRRPWIFPTHRPWTSFPDTYFFDIFA